MKLFAVIPNAFADQELSAVFSTYKNAWDYVRRNACEYQTSIFKSYVVGHYDYPNEVFIVKKYDAFVLDGGVEDVEIFTTSPEGMILPEEFHPSIERHIPDSQEHVFIFDNLVLTKEDLTDAVAITTREIKNIKRDIKESTDLIQIKKLKRVLKGLQYKLLLCSHIATDGFL